VKKVYKPNETPSNKSKYALWGFQKKRERETEMAEKLFEEIMTKTSQILQQK
jgi:hypothetical protein